MMKILILERVLANAIICGARNFANLWLLPVPAMLGQRIGIRAEDELDNFYLWFYTERLGLKVPSIRAGDLGTVTLQRTAQPGELGRVAFGPAVWVFSDPKVEQISGKPMRAGYSDQPHVRERDRLALGSEPRKASDPK
jgi:hypothetical protein